MTLEIGIGVANQESARSWLTCTHRSEETGSPCIGRQVDGYDYCLAHLEPEQLNQALQQLGPGADLEAPGTEISPKVLERILNAVEDENGSPAFGNVSLAQARFTGNAKFARIQCSGNANFTGARFSEGAVFDGAKFAGDALLIGVHVGEDGNVSFTDTRFSEGAWFDGARFGRDASFNAAHFSGNVSFAGARFGGNARFDDVDFCGTARFDGANFAKDAYFDTADFAGDVSFDGTQFGGNARFIEARFERATVLGPLTADNLILEKALFMRPVVIEAAAVRVTCNKTSWEAGVTMRLRYAQVDLKRATFTQQSFIAGIDQPFGLTPGFRRLDESNVLRRVRWDRDVSADPWMPAVLSLRGTDSFNLSTIAVDLSQYHHGFGLIVHLAWRALKGIGRGLLEIIKFIGRALWEIIKEAVKEVSKGLAKGSAVGIGSKLLALVKLLLTLPAIAAFLAWPFGAYRWTYVVPITVGVIAILIMAFLRRTRIADELSIPIRLKYSRNSGWYARHSHTEAGPCGTRWAAIRELVTLRWHLRKADLPFKDSVFSCPLTYPVSRGQVQRRLEAWGDFPADGGTRPLVLLGPAVLADALPDRKARLAFELGLIETTHDFPAEILHAMLYFRGIGMYACRISQQIPDGACVPAGSFHRRSRASSQSADASAISGDWDGQHDSPIGPLLMVTALPGTARFLTDRGLQELPAWEVHAQGIKRPIWVLDPRTSQNIWRPPGFDTQDLSWRGSVAQLSANGATLALRFSVTADETTVFPGAGVLEVGAAVAVIPVPVDTGRPDSPRLDKRRRELSVALSQPLGPRVLLDGNGYPVLVHG
jgi:hypothetical protein